jgi:hypothetical protein
MHIGLGSQSSLHSGSGSTFDNGRQEPLLSSLRSSASSARLDLYSAPYEQRSRISPMDRVTNDFGELNVSDNRRRDSFPVRGIYTSSFCINVVQ